MKITKVDFNNKANNKRNMTSKKIYLIAIASMFFIGIAIGSFAGVLTSENKKTILIEYLNYFFENYNLVKNTSYSFIGTVLKYGKFLIPIWFLGYVKFGPYVSFVLLILKGVSLGYTSYFLYSIFGFYWIFYIFIMYFLTNIIFVPWTILVIYKSVLFSKTPFIPVELYSKTNNKFLQKQTLEVCLLSDYLFLLLASLILISIVGIIESCFISGFLGNYIEHYGIF